MSDSVRNVDSLEDEARAFKRGRAPILMAIAINAALSLGLLGIPYFRGQAHAKDSLAAFSEFAACLFDGQVANSPGLSLPQGERSRFGAGVVSGPADWPGRCIPALATIAPPQATFLWPSMKAAGNDVRRATELLQAELEGVREVATRADAVPERPLRALSKLRAALSILANNASIERDLDRDAITVPDDAMSTAPTRLPLMASVSAKTQLWTTPDSLEVLTIDRLGISWLKLAEGSIERRRPRRTGLVREVLVADGRPFIAWATREGRCSELADHCAHRATGLAAFDTSSDSLPVPGWLQGHPLGRIDHNLRIQGDQVRLLARTADPTLVELRHFSLPKSAAPDLTKKTADKPATPRPEPPTSSQRLRLPGPVEMGLLLEDGSTLLTSRLGSTVSATLFSDGAPPAPLPTVHGQRTWLAQCRTEGIQVIAYGTLAQMRTVATVNGQVHGQLPESFSFPLSPSDDAQAGVQLRCGTGGYHLTYRDQGQQLWSRHCPLTGDCRPPRRIAKRARTVASVVQQDELLVAYTATKHGQIHLARADGQDVPLPPCYHPRSGMCGQPTLYRNGPRVVLSAREGADLLAMQSVDGGRTFLPLPGLVTEHQQGDQREVLRQHRLRKGLD